MIINAKFTGTDSLGYQTGESYNLKLADVKGISIQRIDGSGKCPYQSLSAFFKNWSDIKVQA